MSETTMKNSNGRMQRRNLGEEIERLHDILDGLADALSDSVSTAVKDAVGVVVKEAVQTAVSEVLGNPELLRAALARHEATQPTKVKQTVKRRPMREVVVEMVGWLREKAAEKLAEMWLVLNAVGTYLAAVLLCAGNWFFGGVQSAGQRCVKAWSRVTVVAGRVWQFKKTCLIAAGVGLCCGLAAYVAGPVIAAGMCAVGGTALTVSAMVLVPLGRLLWVGGIDV